MRQSAAALVVQLAIGCSRHGRRRKGLWIIASPAGFDIPRRVNETISSLMLLVYIALAILNNLVEDDARYRHLKKPSTREIGAANIDGSIPGTDVIGGMVFGVIAAIRLTILIYHTVFGFAARWWPAGNLRDARSWASA